MYRLNNKLSINTNIFDDEVQFIFSKQMREYRIKSKKNSILYFQKYIKFLFDSENNCEKIFNKLSKIKDGILYSLENNMCISQELYIKNILKYHDPYYVNNSRKYVSTQVFISEYLGNKCIVKLYLYNKNISPEYKYIVEHNFEDEVLFQKYAHTLNTTCNFTSPEIYDIGELFKIRISNESIPKTKCRFIIMEYLPFISFSDAIFNERDCSRLIQKKEKLDVLLKTNLLHHNDLHARNILLDDVNDRLAIIDFGESRLGPLNPIG